MIIIQNHQSNFQTFCVEGVLCSYKSKNVPEIFAYFKQLLLSVNIIKNNKNICKQIKYKKALFTLAAGGRTGSNAHVLPSIYEALLKCI